eukprot:Pgem_evm1s6031
MLTEAAFKDIDQILEIQPKAELLRDDGEVRQLWEKQLPVSDSYKSYKFYTKLVLGVLLGKEVLPWTSKNNDEDSDVSDGGSDEHTITPVITDGDSDEHTITPVITPVINVSDIANKFSKSPLWKWASSPGQRIKFAFLKECYHLASEDSPYDVTILKNIFKNV